MEENKVSSGKEENESTTQEKITKMVKNKVEEVAGELVGRAGEIKFDAEKVKKETKDYIKKNPEKSVGIVAGVGVILGMILAFLFRRKK